jgi:hypothetical protein
MTVPLPTPEGPDITKSITDFNTGSQPLQKQFLFGYFSATNIFALTATLDSSEY